MILTPEEMADHLSRYSNKLKQETETLQIEEPVFVKDVDIPEEDISTHELSTLCENVTGAGTFEGAQLMKGGLWRLYPKTREARATLLASGLSMKGVAVPLFNQNPFLKYDTAGEEIPSTRLLISNVPLSAANSDILHAIEAQGVTLLSKMRYELGRDNNGRLTRFKTGRRFIHIAIPENPLPRQMKIGIFKAELYHREQRQAVTVNQECYNCLEKGHRAAACTNSVRCRDCKGEGHKSGDPACDWLERATQFEREAQNEAASVLLEQNNTDNTDNMEEEISADKLADEDPLADEEPLSVGATPASNASAAPRTGKKDSSKPSAKDKLARFINRGASKGTAEKRKSPEPNGENDTERSSMKKQALVDGT